MTSNPLYLVYFLILVACSCTFYCRLVTIRLIQHNNRRHLSFFFKARVFFLCSTTIPTPTFQQSNYKMACLLCNAYRLHFLRKANTWLTISVYSFKSNFLKKWWHLACEVKCRYLTPIGLAEHSHQVVFLPIMFSSL